MKAHLHNALVLLLGLAVSAGVSAQADAGKITKIAIVSLIGDVMTVDEARDRIGSSIQSNYRNELKMPSAAFDHTAMGAAEKVIAKVQPAAAAAMLAVPKADSASDPAKLLDDNKVVADNPVITALKANGFSHLLVIRKLRSTAKLRLEDISVGTGMLYGIGFYIDYMLYTQSSQTQAFGRGFIAPYVYIELVLLDLQAMKIERSHAITASTTRGSYNNKTGVDPWGAMTPDDKVSTLQRMIQQAIADNLPAVLGAK